MTATAEVLDDVPVVWEPLPGGQTRFLTCPVREALLEGNRGGGKTESLLCDFAQHVGEGWGGAWRGVVFRAEYKDLDDVVAKSERLFRRIFPTARFLRSKADYRWIWPSGESLAFRAGKLPADYWAYHGHELPFLGFEELTSWSDLTFYLMMQSCCRSAVPGIPKKIRATTNPWGAGHASVKDRFIDPAPRGRIIRERGTQWIWDEDQQAPIQVPAVVSRVAIHCDLRDNVHLLRSQPEYIAQLEAIENAELRKAWLEGDWDVVVGGFLQGVWSRERHVVEPFEIPTHWRRWRAMDWGFRRPYSVGWYASSPDGVIYRYRELYGYGGRPNVGSRETAAEVAKRIRAIEEPERRSGIVFARNPADNSIWDRTGAERSIEEYFRAHGVRWVKADKSPGSRIRGGQVVIEHLREGTFKVFSSCRHWLRTVPVLEVDEHEWEDVDCFVGGTLVSTPQGERPIETVAVGELVDTPIGPHPVLRSYRSGPSATVRLELSNGRSLQGTPRHKIYVSGKGLVPLSEIRIGDRLTEEHHPWAALDVSPIAASSTADRPRAGTINPPATISSEVGLAFTARSGSTPSGLSRRECTSTIETAIWTTTGPKTWSFSQPPNMRSGTIATGVRSSPRVSRIGANRYVGELSYVGMVEHCTRAPQRGHLRALIVEALREHDTRRSGSARLSVRAPEPVGERRHARSVAARFGTGRIASARPKPAAIVVVGRSAVPEPQPVYNLTVDVAHLFLCSGVVSSNTDQEDHGWDETRYSLVSRHTPTERKRRAAAKAGTTFDDLTAPALRPTPAFRRRARA